MDGTIVGRVKDAAPYDGAVKHRTTPVRCFLIDRVSGHRTFSLFTFPSYFGKKAAVRHPRRGGDGGLAALPRGLRQLRMALWDAWGFRPLRRVGVSLAAASGSFARCDGRPEALPLDSAIF